MGEISSRVLRASAVLLLSGAFGLLWGDDHAAIPSVKSFGQLPLSFEANHGQAGPQVKFISRAAGHQLLLEKDAVVLTSPENTRAIRLKLTGANPRAEISGVHELPGKSNYFPSGDAKTWITDVPTYTDVKYQSVYRGIDLVYYGKQGLLEYDFVVAPHADPSDIAFDVEGADHVQIDSHGALILKSESGDIRFDAPVIYQLADTGARQIVPGHYAMRGQHVNFEIASYDHSRPLIIDPVLTYSTYVGIPNDSYTVATADAAGNVYMAGKASNVLTVLKLSSDGTTQLYRTQLTSGFTFTLYGIAVDGAGKVYLAGSAGQNLVTTPNAFQTSATTTSQHAFVAVVNAAGSALDYCSYLTYQSGTGSDQANGIAVDSTGKFYITGFTSSLLFPTTTGVFQTTTSSSQTGFVAKFDPSKSGAASLVYSTYLGGATTTTSEFGIAVDSTFNAYVTGFGGTDFPTTPTAFHYTGTQSASGGVYVTKLNANATSLVYSAYLGFQNNNFTAIAVDGAGDAYVTGVANVADFPTTAGAYQTSFPGAYVSELNANGSTLVYSTFLNGSSEAPATPVSVPTSIALKPNCVSACNAYVAGFTPAPDFPAVNAVQSFNANCELTTSCGNDAFAVELSGNGATAVFSTYLGGSLGDEGNQNTFHVPAIAVTSGNDAVIAGLTSSTDFPTTVTPQPLGRGNFAARITAAASAKALVPTSLTFTVQQPVPVPSTPLNVTLRNVGSAVMNISSIPVSGPYSKTEDCIPSLAAGAFCTISVTFTPTVSGTSPGTLTINSNATNSPTAVPLSGTGINSAYINLTPASLDFGNQTVGTAATSKTVTLSNIGNSFLTINSITVAGTNISDFFQTNNCPISPASLASNASCLINVSFLPTQVNLRSASISVSSNTSSLANSTVNLSGTGAGVGVSALTLSATGLTFPSQAVGTTSTGQSVIITNTGNVPVTISSVVANADYVLTGCAATSPSNVNPGATCTVTVKFAPTAAGARPATVTITDNTAAGTHSFTLSGTGVADSQSLLLTPASLVFPDTSVGQTSKTLQLVATNTGTFSVTFDRVFETGDYQITTSGCTLLKPVASCTTTIQFKPTGAGNRPGTITMVDTATGSPHVVNLSGKGVADAVTAIVSPVSLAFSTQPVGLASSSQNVVVTNTGNVPINPTANFTGPNGPDFTIFSNGCSTAISPARTCTLGITFAPSAPGARSANLVVSDEAGTQTVALSGTGQTASFSIAFVPAPSPGMTFQNQAINIASSVQNLQVVNNGNEPITFTGITPSGPFSLGFGCSVSTPINPNTSCIVPVTFTPTGLGLQNGSITFTSNAAGSPHTYNLKGTGVTTAPTILTNPAGLAFGSVVVGVTSSQLNVTLQNTTAAAVTGVSVGVPTGNFAVSSNSCTSGTIGASSSCSVGITFTPTASGVRTGSVNITYTGGSASVSLAGFGATSNPSAFARQTSLTFADQVLNTTSTTQNINLVNNGNVAVTVSSVTGGGANPSDFTISNSCSTVNPGLSCNVGVSFTPAAAGTRNATVTITDTAPGSPRIIALKGKGLTPVQGIVVDRSKLNFTSQVKATTSNSQTINVTNTGNAAVTISSVTTTGAAAADYAVINSCPLTPSTLPAGPSGNSCTVGVTFTPSAAGARNATITITDSSPTSPHTITLSGTGVAPTKTLSVSPVAVVFDPQVVGTSSGFTQTVMVYNTGNAGVTFTGVTVTGNFSLGSNSCTGTLAPGTIVTLSSCSIQVQFTPTTSGNRTGTLKITDDATPGTQNVPLSGNGITSAQGISLSQTSVFFDQQVVGTPSPQAIVYYYNQSNVTVNITSVVLTGTDFTMVNGCLTSVSPSSFCTIKITFNPAAPAGTKTGNIKIIDSATGSPRTISLTGIAVTAPSPGITLNPTSLTFADQAVGVGSAPQNINLTNSGETNLTISGVTVTGANPGDFLLSNPCPSTLTAGFSCTIGVTFKPTATGNRAGTVSVSDNASGSPHTVAVSGKGINGVGPAVTLTPPTLTFTDVPVNTTSGSQSSTLKNTGQAALSISNIAVTGGIPGDFTLFNTTCPLSPATVAVNGTCTITVKFSPSSVIDQTAAVRITDNAVDSPQSLNLVGNGTAPAVNLSTTSLTFAARNVGTTSPAQTVTLQNVGNLTLNVGSVTATGDFAVTANTCTGAIGPGLTCTFGVTFKPTATGPRTGFVMIGDNAGDSPQFISLSGTGQ